MNGSKAYLLLKPSFLEQVLPFGRPEAILHRTSRSYREFRIVSVSSLLPKKRESDGHTHEWKVYVKPYASNEDMSSYVKKVQFKARQDDS